MVKLAFVQDQWMLNNLDWFWWMIKYLFDSEAFILMQHDGGKYQRGFYVLWQSELDRWMDTYIYLWISGVHNLYLWQLREKGRVNIE